MTMKITPKFHAQKIVDETLGRYWMEFQSHVYHTADSVLRYMQSHISANTKKSTGELQKAITLGRIHAPGTVGFHIGHITTLNRVARHWAILNFGGRVNVPVITPRVGKALKFKGKDGKTVFAKSVRARSHVIKGIHYVESTHKMLYLHIQHLLTRLRRM